MPQFKDIEIRSYSYDKFEIRINNFWYIMIDIKYKTYFCNFNEPEMLNYNCGISKNTIYGYKLAIGLKNFYNNPNLHNWIKFLKLDIDKRKWWNIKVLLKNIRFIKNTSTIQKAIDTSLNNYYSAKEWKNENKLNYEKDLKCYYKNKTKVENIIQFLIDEGYNEEQR